MTGIKNALSFMTRHMIVLSLLAAPMTVLSEQPGVALLDFELHDLTSRDESPVTMARAKRLNPALRLQLEESHGLILAPPPDSAVIDEPQEEGPVFNQPAAAASLGSEMSVDWLVSCRLQSSDEPFIYLRAQLIDVSRKRVAADFVVEVSNDEPDADQEGIVALANQIADTLETLNIIP